MKKKEIKIVGLDLDGTLLTHKTNKVPNDYFHAQRKTTTNCAIRRSGRRACGGGRRQCAVGTGTTHDSKTPPAQTGRGFSFKHLPESRPRRKGLEHGKFGHNIDA